MSQDERSRQKALLKKKRKDKERKKKFNPLSLSDVVSYSYKVALIKRSREFPIHECLIDQDWRIRGLAQIWISRKQPDGRFIIGVFLVDLFCLGVKNAFCNANLSSQDYEKARSEMVMKSPVETCHPRLAHRIIYGAVDYAACLGFAPHKDFKVSRFVLDERSDADSSFDVEFGKDGKPFFIAGDYDNVDYVMKQLTKRVGEGNFDYLFPVKL